MNKSFLTFLLDSNICAVDIATVLEVLTFENITPVPGSEPYIEGLIFSRGQGIKVINLRKRFGMESKAADKNTKIVVISVTAETEEGEKTNLYGLVADKVLDVQTLDDEATVQDIKTNIPQGDISQILATDNGNVLVLAFEGLLKN